MHDANLVIAAAAVVGVLIVGIAAGVLRVLARLMGEPIETNDAPLPAPSVDVSKVASAVRGIHIDTCRDVLSCSTFVCEECHREVGECMGLDDEHDELCDTCWFEIYGDESDDDSAEVA